MDTTSVGSESQLQAAQSRPEGFAEGLPLSFLVNVGISEQNQTGGPGEAWNPDGHFTNEKPRSKQRVDVYRNDVVVRFDRTSKQPEVGVKRGEITVPTRESMNRLFLYANNADVVFRMFVTLTIHASLWALIEVDRVKAAFHAYLVRARRSGWGNAYLWVREHMKNGAPHFHIMHPFECEQSLTYWDERGAERTVDRDLSRALSVWWVDQLCKGFRWCELCAAGRYVECETRGGFCGEAFRKMAYPKTDRGGFCGACRGELIRASENAGGYLSKECSKRLQKAPPQLWAKAGRWWGASRGVKATPVVEGYLVDADELFTREVQTDQGTFEAYTKLQYGLGKRILSQISAIGEPKSDEGRKP